MSADPFRQAQQYRRRRSQFGRDMDRILHWLRERVIPRAWLAAVMFMPVAAVMIQAAPANASPVDSYTAEAGPVVCDVLDDYPTVGGVQGVVEGVIEDSGFTAFQAGQVVGLSVTTFCPYHSALLRRYVAVYGEKSTTGLVLR